MPSEIGVRTVVTPSLLTAIAVLAFLASMVLANGLMVVSFGVASEQGSQAPAAPFSGVTAPSSLIGNAPSGPAPFVQLTNPRLADPHLTTTFSPAATVCATTSVGEAACAAAEASLSPNHPAAVPTWNHTIANFPSAREGAPMVYDAADGYVVLYGGLNDTTSHFPGDTWTFKAGTWTNITATSGGVSPGLIDSSMAYDANDGYVVMYGGGHSVGASTYIYAETMKFVGGKWTQLTPTLTPPAEFGAALAYDAADKEVVMFGGASVNLYMRDTYTFAAGQWTNITGSSCNPGCPSDRYTAGMTYDAADGYILMFGGLYYNGATTYVGDTWSFLGGKWTAQTPTNSPAARGFITYDVSYDPDISAVVLYGGDVGGSCGQDTWTYAAGQWTAQSPTNVPDAGDASAIVADTPDDYGAMMTNGYDCTIKASMYNVYNYYAPIGPLTATLTASKSTVEVGQKVWFNATSSGGKSPYTYRIRTGDGGTSAATSVEHGYNDSGTFTAWLWVNDSEPVTATGTATVTVTPGPTVSASAAPSTGDVGTPVVFTATGHGGTGTLSYLWEFGDGQHSTGASPSHSYAVAGDYTAWVWANDSVGGSGANSVAVTVNSALTAPTITATPSPTETGLLVNFGFTGGTGGTPPYTPLWRFGDGGVSSVASPSYAFAKAGTYTVWLWQNDSAGASKTAQFAITVDAGLAITSFTGNFSSTVTSPTLDLGMKLSTNIAFTGGVAPYTFTYAGLPTGCSAPTGAHLTCTPTAAGSYTLNVSVKDSLGKVVWVTPLALTVNTDPKITAFSVNPTSVNTGSTATFTLTTSGGTPTLTAVWTGLPGGCSATSFTITGGSCAPSSSGSYTVNVTVTDGLGQSVSQQITLTVNSGGASAFGGLLLYGIIGIIAVVAVVAVVLMMMRKKKKGQDALSGGAAAGGAGAGAAAVAPAPGGAYPTEPSAQAPPPGYGPGQSPDAMYGGGAPSYPPQGSAPVDPSQQQYQQAPPSQYGQPPAQQYQQPPPQQYAPPTDQQYPQAPAQQYQQPPPQQYQQPAPQYQAPPQQYQQPPPQAAPAYGTAAPAGGMGTSCVVCGAGLDTTGRCPVCGWHA